MTAEPRSAARLLLDRQFGPFFVAHVLTSVGIWVHAITASLIGYELTGSASVVALVNIALFAPQVLLGPLSGSHADRGDVRAQLLLGRLLGVIGSLGLAGWWLLDSTFEGRSAVVAVIASSFIGGLGMVVGGPAILSTGPRLVAANEIPTATALSGASSTIGRVAGPALSGLMIAWASFDAALVLAGVTHALAMLALLAVTVPSADQDSDLGHRMRDAVAYVRSRRVLLRALTGAALLGVATEPLIVLAPALVEQAGGSSASVGTLMAAYGLGAAAATVAMAAAIRRVPVERIVVLGLIIMLLSTAPLLVAASTPWLITLFAVIGVGFVLVLTALNTIVLVAADASMRGRVMAMWMMALLGSRPLASGVVGVTADLASLAAAIGVVIAVVVTAIWVCRPAALR